MSTTVAEEPRILHTLPGRVRIHFPTWSGQGKRRLETQLRQMRGIRSVQANDLTHNVLIQFDPAVIDEQTLLTQVRTLDLRMLEATEEAAPPPVHHEKQGQTIRACIAVRGLERDPHLAKRVIDRLQSYAGVRASANSLTGRVLVEFSEHEVDPEDLISEVADLELPDLPGESRPAYPLDPGPLFQSISRTLGSALGLGLLAFRRLFAFEDPLPGATVALQTSSIISIVQSIPPVRYGLRRFLGRTVADLLINIPSIITQTLAGSPLGLTVTLGESLRLLTAVYPQRTAWKRHEERIAHAPSAQPHAIIRLEAGERTPLAAKVLDGTGTGIGRDGMPQPVVQGNTIPPGMRLYGGPFVLQLQPEKTFDAFTPQPRPAPQVPSLYEHYLRWQGPFVLAYTALTAILTRSFSRIVAALMLVNPRTALIGVDTAELSATARVIRAGCVVVGTRPNRPLRLPHLVLLDGVRVLTDRLEVSSVLPLAEEEGDTTTLLAQAAGIAAAAGSPWGGAFKAVKIVAASDGNFDGKMATARLEGMSYTLGPVDDWHALPGATRLRQRGNFVLVLRREDREKPLGLFALRPQLAPGVSTLVQTCQHYGVELAIVAGGDQLASQALAQRVHIPLVESNTALEAIRARQLEGGYVAFMSDNAAAQAGFAACDLAIGLSDERSRFPARADLLAPDLEAVAAIIEAGAQREATVRDSIWLSVLSNIVGAIWGFRAAPGIEAASRVVYITVLAALVDGWARLRGGKRSGATMIRLTDPRPERWGRRGIEETLHTLRTSREGLSSAQAAQRWQRAVPQTRRNRLLSALLDQLRSPLLGILAVGAGLSLLLGSTTDVLIITATIVTNVAVGVWQEHKADQVAETLKHLGTSSAAVLRDGHPLMISAEKVVPGDILLLTPGTRIAADARVLDAQGLEVDEAALTGESLPVSKAPHGATDASRIVLEGSDVTTGTGHAVVFAVGRQTRMGATTAALSVEEEQQSPLGVRLSKMLRVFIPLSIMGGAIVVGSGLLWGKPLTALLATGATVALAGVPEGLPLLTRVGESGVAHRLAQRDAVVRRLSAIEALGRVDVACADKTGTMTEGRLVLSLVKDSTDEARLPGKLSGGTRYVLLTAALASPHPDTPGAHAHPTDAAVILGAREAGLGEVIQVKHEEELAFDPVRSFHVTLVDGRCCVKGAPEVLLPRCTTMLQHSEKVLLDENGRERWLTQSRQLAARGLRVLMVAEGVPDLQLEDPQGLTVLGFVGISDPLRETVRAAVRRCHEAGVRVIMITGDHPATARTIAREAGLLNNGGDVLAATEIAELQNGELDARLERAVVVARATPLDKLRIIESLQRHGHTVAMTGDGVNDAPALRLADVGVAMGQGGTEVARQTADVVIANDDFSTLVETFVEGRSFWRNIRRALGLLLGGNLGELGLVVGASLLGGSTPLTVSQILAVNAITDILPALAVALQQPEHRVLATLSREGEAALNKPLRNEVFLRGIATAVPSLASYLVMLGAGALPEARSVAFASIVTTQLAQTLDAGRSEGTLTRPVRGAVAGSAGILLAAFAVPALRNFLQLVVPSPLGWALIGAGTLLALLLHYLLTSLTRNYSDTAPSVPQRAPAYSL
ncbi:MAG TPA: HAD-IC family P-type ATPase [Ktedonosporobacter sp.]|nr:HAD-IC family P-type ATPase [Ktedonosporobacter sp.]